MPPWRRCSEACAEPVSSPSAMKHLPISARPSKMVVTCWIPFQIAQARPPHHKPLLTRGLGVLFLVAAPTCSHRWPQIHQLEQHYHQLAQTSRVRSVSQLLIISIKI